MCRKPKVLWLLLVAVLAVPPQANAEGRQGVHRLSLGFIPISWAWMIGSSDAYSDNKIDDSNLWNVGVTLRYDFLPLRYLSIGIQLDSLHPFGANSGYASPNRDGGDRYDMIRGQLGIRGIWPILEDRLELSVQLVGGGNWMWLGNHYEGRGWSARVGLGATGWMPPRLGVFVELGAGVDSNHQTNDGQFGAIHRYIVAEPHLGVSYRF